MLCEWKQEKKILKIQKKKLSRFLFAIVFPVVLFLTIGVFAFSSFLTTFGTVQALSGNGGIVYVGKNSTVNMTSGTLMGASATNGGAVYVASGGTFNLSGGLIYNNTAINGNQIYNNGTFAMTGGTIGQESVYTIVDENGDKDANGNYILFGSYPQTIKASDVTIDETNVDANGYYLGSDGERYAKSTAVQNTSPGPFFSDASMITAGTDYYFKVEPIIWKISKIENGNALCVSKFILDYLSYGYNNGYYGSSLRSWLNNEFFNISFSSNERAIINKSTFNCETASGTATVSDNIYLLSSDEILNDNLVLSDDRIKVIKDFARNKGIIMYSTIANSTGEWYCRNTNDISDNEYACIGSWGDYSISYATQSGIVPALSISIGDSSGTTGYGVYNTGSMNIYGGNVYDDIYSSVTFSTKMGANISGTIALGDGATITVEDYAGTTPTYSIVVDSTRGAGTILTFKGSSTKPDLSRLNIKGFDANSVELVANQNADGDWTVSLVYAQRTVTFDPQFGMVSETSRTVGYGEKIGTLPVPTREGYNFAGWYTSIQNSGTEATKIDENYVITDNCIFYAWWKGYYTRTDENGNESLAGDYILFGSYPKTIKASGVTINEAVVDSFGYYLGSDGERYAKIKADPFRSSYVYSDGTKIVADTEYYFKVEPIKWKILSESDGEAILLAEEVLAANVQFYTNSSDTRTKNKTAVIEPVKTQINPNNYEYSAIRAWLNSYNGSGYSVDDFSSFTAGDYLSNGFFNQAFSENEQNIILTTMVDNSASTTDSSYNQYNCDNTEDKIWLLSYQEATSLYGLTSETRQKVSTDYAMANNALADNNYGVWWLRSPGSTEYNASMFVDDEGSYGSVNVDEHGLGVLPALKIKLESSSSSFASNVHNETEDIQNNVSTKEETKQNLTRLFEICMDKNIIAIGKQDMFFEKRKFDIILNVVQENDNKE